MTKQDDYPLLVAKYSGLWRIVALFGCLLWGLLTLTFSLKSDWGEWNWFLRIGFCLAVVIFPLGFRQAFLYKILFTKETIVYRSLLGRVLKRKYSQTELLVHMPGEALVVHFSDKKRVKIHAQTGNLDRMIAVIIQHAEKPVPVKIVS